MLIKKIGGNWHEVETWNNIVIGYKSGGIVIIDPQAAEPEEHYIPFYDFAGFRIEGNTLYVKNRGEQYFMLDLTGIETKLVPSPPIKSFFGGPGGGFFKKSPLVAEGVLEEPRAIDTCGDITAVAYKQKGIDFFRASDGEKIAHFDFPGYSFIDSIKLNGTTLYIADVFGLRILDIKDFKNFRLDDRFTYQKGWAKDAAVYKNYVLVADVLGIKIFDKKNAFAMVGKVETNRNRVAKVVTHGNYAYLSCEAMGLKIVDLSDISNPRLAGGMVLPAGVWDCAVREKSIFLAAYTGGLLKVHGVNIRNLEQEATFEAVEEVIGVTVSNRAVYAACSYEGFKILDHDLNLLSEIKDLGGRCWTVLEAGGLVFAACGEEGIYVYDAGNLEQPRLVIRIPTSQARDLVVWDRFLYVADGREGALVFDIHDIQNVKRVKQIPSAAFTRSIMVDENYIYKADGDGGAEVYERI